MSKSNSLSSPERFQRQIPHDSAGNVRVDTLLKQYIQGLSHRIRNELFLKKAVLINGRPVVKGFKTSPGDRLEVILPGPLTPFQSSGPFPRPLTVYEDHSLLVVVKPALVPAHPLSPFETGTLAHALVAAWPQVLQVGHKPLEPGLVHRLDLGTSGLMAVALTHQSWLQMKKDLAARKWRKTYQALIEGFISKPLSVSFPLAHDPTDERKMKIINGPGDYRRGRVYQAVTLVRPLSRYSDSTLVEVDLITGVTHQIRVHLAVQGLPLIGDTLYGSRLGERLGLPPGRIFLHAAGLSLPHPITRETVSCTAELPEDLQAVLDSLKY